jgi:hypothetical protein
MAGYSFLFELIDEDCQIQEVMSLLNPRVKPEIIHLFHGFVDGIVLLTGNDPNSCSAISFFRSKAVSFWVSRDDAADALQN